VEADACRPSPKHYETLYRFLSPDRISENGSSLVMTLMREIDLPAPVPRMSPGVPRYRTFLFRTFQSNPHSSTMSTVTSRDLSSVILVGNKSQWLPAQFRQSGISLPRFSLVLSSTLPVVIKLSSTTQGSHLTGLQE
jgi:hypothetical protein